MLSGSSSGNGSSTRARLRFPTRRWHLQNAVDDVSAFDYEAHHRDRELRGRVRAGRS
jgi:hypothetical protein